MSCGVITVALAVCRKISSIWVARAAPAETNAA